MVGGIVLGVGAGIYFGGKAIVDNAGAIGDFFGGLFGGSSTAAPPPLPPLAQGVVSAFNAHVPIPGTSSAYFTMNGVFAAGRNHAIRHAFTAVDPLHFLSVVESTTGWHPANPLMQTVGDGPNDYSNAVAGGAEFIGGVLGGAWAGAAGGMGGASEGLGSGRAYSVAFETTLEELPEAAARTTSRAPHFRAANIALSDALSAETLEQLGIEIPRSNAGTILGESPAGWSWHHVPDSPGTLQLVPRSMHQGSAWQRLLHPGGVGGFKLWGADY